MFADIRRTRPDEVRYQCVDHAPDGFVDEASASQPGILAQHKSSMARKYPDARNVLQAEQPGTQPVINVMVVVRDFIAKIGDLCLE